MAYIFFGSSPSEVTTDSQGNLVGGISLKVWSKQTGGNRVTDLRDMGGQPLPGVVVSNDEAGPDLGRIRFQASDQHMVLYLDRGYGQRWMVTSDQLSEIVNESIARSGIALTQSSSALTESAEAKQSADHALSTATQIRTDVTAFGAIGDGVTDDHRAFQAAIDSNPYGAHVIIPKGTYRIGGGKLLLRAGTWLEAEHGAHIIRASDDYLLANGIQGIDTSTGYDGAGDIRITGGVWDGNGVEFPSKASIMHLAHSHDVLVERAEFRDVARSHHIEFNACRNIRATQCRFLGYVDDVSQDKRNEAIQLDMAYPGATNIGADDGTPCRDVVIEHCFFGPSGTTGSLNLGSGIGSHTALSGYQHTNVSIRDCIFESMRGEAIRTLAYVDTVIDACRTTNSLRSGVEIRDSVRTRVTDSTIINPGLHGIHIIGGQQAIVSGNTMDTVTPAGSRAIYASASATDVAMVGNTAINVVPSASTLYASSGTVRVHITDNIIPGSTVYNASAGGTPDANGNIT